MSNYTIQNNEFFLNDKLFFTAPTPIKKVVFNGDSIFVLFQEKDPFCLTATIDSNVCCLDVSKRTVWEIEPFNTVPGQGYYTDIVFQGNELWVYTTLGFYCLVDKETGKIVKKNFAK